MRRKWDRSKTTKVTAWILIAALVMGACPLTTRAEQEKTEEEVLTKEDSAIEEESSEYESEESSSAEEQNLEYINDSRPLSFAKIGNVSKTCPTIGENGNVTFHYYPTDGEEVTEAYVKGSWDASWSDHISMSEDENGVWSVTTNKLSLDKSYEYGIVVNESSDPDHAWRGDATNPRDGGNSQILRNPVSNSDGSVTIFYYPQGNEEVVLVYTDEKGTEEKKKLYKDAYHSALLSTTVSEAGNYEYYLLVDGSKVTDKNCKEAKFIIGKLPEDNKDIKSPVIENKKVTFNYYGPTAKEVFLAGSMTSWGDNKESMSYDKQTGFWSISMELDPGKYEYKFIVDGSWMQDPRNINSNGDNSEFNLAATNDDVKSPVINTNNTKVTFNYYSTKAKTVSLAGEMNGWNKEADFMSYDEETGFWSITKKLKPGCYEYKFVVDGNDWRTDPRNQETRNGNSLLTIEEKEYTYHIYYYSKDFSDAKNAAMWIWQDGGAGGIQYDFDEIVTLEDDHQWLSADVNIDLSSISVIPKFVDTWNGQDVTKVFANENKEKDVTIYIVDEDANVYTQLPDVEKEVTYDRYVLIEYERPEGDYEGWNIYSWNTGIKSEYVVDFTDIAGKKVAYLPVDKTKDSVSFCMRRSESGNEWAQKDGGDHCVQIPLDQKVVKARFVQDQGVVGNVAFNTGYETNPTQKTVQFFYRDDEKFKEYQEASLKGKVSLIFDEKKYEMSYDDKNERYVTTMDLEAGEHAYAYMVEDELLLDAFNTETIDVNGKTYSLFSYKTYEILPSASVTPSQIDYNQNAVVEISLGDDVPSDLKVDQILLDLTQLGLSNEFEVDPSLLAGTIAVKDTVSTGKKNIPVKVKDQFGNVYETQTEVTVLKRNAKNDFDWDEAVIYFAVTDRFFDGNESNNDAYGKGTYDKSQGSMYHGGDFAGLTKKLDYLKELGVNTIWITPIVENTEYITDCGGYPGQKNSGYHGYWASDFTSLNKHLGTEEEFSTLINELHKRDMKLMVDVVLNHAGYTTDDLFNDTFISGKNMLRDSSNTIAGDDKKGSLSDLPDFVTEDPEVSKLLVEWQSSWISKYAIDYYRVDTVKHVDDVTWKEFKNELTLKNPAFKMIGEYAGAGYATNFGQLGTGQMDALLDFDFNDKALDFCDGKLEEVEKFLEDRNHNINNTATMGSFIGSHDEDGFMYRLVKERGKDKETAYALSKVAATMQITAKGQPVIYYGEELGQTGANNYPYQENRYDFAWEKANDQNDMLVHYKKLLAIRNKYTDVFAKGNRQQVMVQDKSIVVKRSHGSQELFIGMNVDPIKDTELVLETKTPMTKFTDLYADKVYETDKEGKLQILLPSAQNGGTVILKKGISSNANTEINVDVSGTINVGSQNTTVSISIAASNIRKLVEPTFRLISGKIVKGWDKVIKAYIDDAMQNMVPLAAGLDGTQKHYVEIPLEKNVIRMIPQSAVKLMRESGENFKFKVSDQVYYLFDHETLEKINGNINLNMIIDDKKDFGQGFHSFVIDPVTEGDKKITIPVLVNLGKENAGKVVFIFHRNVENHKVEPLTFSWIDADGNIEVKNAVYTDLIFLY